ncbi:MAG: SHOCT domain-containing protein [Myxococcota bacterium]
MWHDMDWHGWGGHMFGWWGLIIMFLFIVALAVVVLRSGGDNGRAAQPLDEPDSPMDILEKRYASGEIDREEYEQKKRDLES